MSEPMTDLERKKKELAEKKERLRRVREQGQGRVSQVNLQELEQKIMPREQTSSQDLKQQQELQSPEKQRKPEKKKDLTFESYVGEIFIGTKEVIQIEKEIQCDLEEQIKQKKKSEEIEEIEQALPAKHKESRARHESQSFNASQILHPVQAENLGTVQPVSTELTPEDIEQITKSGEFTSFFTRCSKLIEKALDQKDVELFEDKFDEMVNVDDHDKKDPLKHENKYFDQQYCANRVITALQWSPNLPDVFLAGYSQNEEGNINDPVGVVLLWSQSLKTRPEFHCFCQSQITSAQFYPYNNNLVIGGCYNGSIVIWDLRAKTMPVQRSSQDGHAYPIYSLDVVGTQNAHNIVSISNDGTLCTWNMNMLNQPQKKVHLKNDDGAELNVTAMSFKGDDSNNFYIGCEDGALHHAQLHSNEQNLVQNYYSGHLAPISSISQNNLSEHSPYLSNLILTSSFDWTVKLWNPSVSDKCLYTFENNEDYIYDVQWNRTNPCLFATADGEMYIDIWDLQEDLEMPVGRHANASKNSVNKIQWSNNGEKLISGDSKGNIDLYSLQKKFLKYDSSRLHEIEALLKSSNSEE